MGSLNSLTHTCILGRWLEIWEEWLPAKFLPEYIGLLFQGTIVCPGNDSSFAATSGDSLGSPVRIPSKDSIKEVYLKVCVHCKRSYNIFEKDRVNGSRHIYYIDHFKQYHVA